jgi:hypothetical protein
MAREWIVESASAADMHSELAEATLGILSAVRRKALLDDLQRHEWSAVWQTVSVSDLHFLGDFLSENAPKGLWRCAQLNAMKIAAKHDAEPDMLGSVAPELSGSDQPQLRRYEPYEEYQRLMFPNALAQRLAELKINLAWIADNAAWEPAEVIRLAEPSADDLVGKLKMRDSWDWNAAALAFRSLDAPSLERLLGSN